MSFFGGMGGRGFDDRVFGDMHRMMRNQMFDMDAHALFDPFGMMGGRVAVGEDGRYRSPRQQMIDEENNNGRNRRSTTQERGSVIPPQQIDPMTSMMMQPFGFGLGGGMFGNLMRQMEQLHSQALNNSSPHVRYSQVTVSSMTPGDDGRPQYYEATESVRKAGDVKETRRSVRDTHRGVEKMAIGHHIGDRGHVIEKRRDRTTNGRILENQEFIGLNPGEAQQFDQEWTQATRRAVKGAVDPRLAIEEPSGSPRRNRKDKEKKSPSEDQGRRRSDTRKRTKPTIVVVEEPEEDTPEKKKRTSKGGGPTIVELD